MDGRLVSMIYKAVAEYMRSVVRTQTLEFYLADYLIANGVIVPPCPIGTKIYMLVTKRAKPYPEYTFIKDSKLTFSNLERVIERFGKTVFLSREEAEQKLKGGVDNA